MLIVKALLLKILNWINANRVVASGTSNGWTYKKYADGTFEAWLPPTSKGSQTLNSGSPTWKAFTDNNQFPFTYNSVTVSIEASCTSIAAWVANGSMNSSRYISFYLMSSSTSPGTLTIQATAHGKWK